MDDSNKPLAIAIPPNITRPVRSTVAINSIDSYRRARKKMIDFQTDSQIHHVYLSRLLFMIKQLDVEIMVLDEYMTRDNPDEQYQPIYYANKYADPKKMVDAIMDIIDCETDLPKREHIRCVRTWLPYLREEFMGLRIRFEEKYEKDAKKFTPGALKLLKDAVTSAEDELLFAYHSTLINYGCDTKKGDEMLMELKDDMDTTIAFRDRTVASHMMIKKQRHLSEIIREMTYFKNANTIKLYEEQMCTIERIFDEAATETIAMNQVELQMDLIIDYLNAVYQAAPGAFKRRKSEDGDDKRKKIRSKSRDNQN